MTTILIFCSLGLLIGLAWHFFSPPKVSPPLQYREDPSRKELMEMLWCQLSKQAAKQQVNTTLDWKTIPSNDELIKYINEIIKDDKVKITIKKT
jgi:hypothetical protein